jgi:hypothetical protein
MRVTYVVRCTYSVLYGDMTAIMTGHMPRWRCVHADEGRRRLNALRVKLNHPLPNGADRVRYLQKYKLSYSFHASTGDHMQPPVL